MLEIFFLSVGKKSNNTFQNLSYKKTSQQYLLLNSNQTLLNWFEFIWNLIGLKTSPTQRLNLYVSIHYIIIFSYFNKTSRRLSFLVAVIVISMENVFKTKMGSNGWHKQTVWPKPKIRDKLSVYKENDKVTLEIDLTLLFGSWTKLVELLQSLLVIYLVKSRQQSGFF